MCQYFSRTEDQCLQAMKQAIKKTFENNMHYHAWQAPPFSNNGRPGKLGEKGKKSKRGDLEKFGLVRGELRIFFTFSWFIFLMEAVHLLPAMP